MKLKRAMVYPLLILFLFTLNVNGTLQPTVQEEEMMEKIKFSNEAEAYVTNKMEEKKWEKHPREKLAVRLIDIKNELMKKSTEEAGKKLKELGARIESEDIEKEKKTKFYPSEEVPRLFKKYSERRFEFEIQHVFVSKIPDTEERYLGEQKPENRIDMVAYVVFKYRLVEKKVGKKITDKNISGTGTFICRHMEICVW